MLKGSKFHWIVQKTQGSKTELGCLGMICQIV